MNPGTKLTELIYNASVAAFSDWRKAFPSEQVFAFALSTLDDAIYVSASLNSIESHNRCLKKRKLEPLSPDGLGAKWGPWEWENEFTGNTHFSVVDGHLKFLSEQATEGSFGKFRSTVMESMVKALLGIRQNGIVTNNGDPSGIVMFATIYDSLAASSLHRISAELLNQPETITELLSAIGG